MFYILIFTLPNRFLEINSEVWSKEIIKTKANILNKNLSCAMWEKENSENEYKAQPKEKKFMLFKEIN